MYIYMYTYMHHSCFISAMLPSRYANGMCFVLQFRPSRGIFVFGAWLAVNHEPSRTSHVSRAWIIDPKPSKPIGCAIHDMYR